MMQMSRMFYIFFSLHFAVENDTIQSRKYGKGDLLFMKLGIGVHTLDSISPYLSINAAKA